MTSPAPWLSVSPEVTRALAAGRPVVALESTVIAHGLPWPVNLDLARTLEATVRAAGATPATIAVLHGRPTVGLADAELVHLASAAGIRKISRRDLPLVVAGGLDGATTVAATMWLAAQAGIRVFATGGIGGVHRGQPFDVSADLPELARTSVAVVCAGAKSILDLALTLEWLETHGVPVLGYQTDRFPAFFVADSGLPVDERCDSVADVVAVLDAKWGMGLDGGVLVAVPVPEEHALDAAVAEAAIGRALAAAETAGVRGKALTPFLLRAVSAETGGESMAANVALLRNNAGLAAEIAVTLARRQLE